MDKNWFCPCRGKDLFRAKKYLPNQTKVALEGQKLCCAIDIGVYIGAEPIVGGGHGQVAIGPIPKFPWLQLFQ